MELTIDYKLYRIVSGLIISEDKILLVQNKDEHADYIWSIPGGVVESSESLKDALIREISEEVGLLVKEMELAYIHESFIPKYNAQSLVTVFKLVVKNDTPKINDPDGEIVQVKWVEIKNLKNYIKNQAILNPLLTWLESRKTFYSLNEAYIV